MGAPGPWASPPQKVGPPGPQAGASAVASNMRHTHPAGAAAAAAAAQVCWYFCCNGRGRKGPLRKQGHGPKGGGGGEERTLPVARRLMSHETIYNWLLLLRLLLPFLLLLLLLLLRERGYTTADVLAWALLVCLGASTGGGPHTWEVGLQGDRIKLGTAWGTPDRHGGGSSLSLREWNGSQCSCRAAAAAARKNCHLVGEDGEREGDG